MNKRLLTAFLPLCLATIVLADGLSKQELGQLKGEAMMAYKNALTAQKLLETAKKRRNAEEVAAQEQIADQEFRKLPSLLSSLAEDDSKKTWKFIVKIADKVPEEYGAHEAVLKAADGMKDPGVQADIKRSCLKFKSPHIRRALVLNMANRKEWGVLLSALKDKDEDVAALAAWRLADNKVESAVVPMIDQFEKLEQTRAGIWDVLRNGLGRMLGKRCNSAIEYRSLWEIVQSQGGLAKVNPEEVKPEAGEMSSGVRLFGREIDCTRVVFVLDVSGSMKQIDSNQKLYDDGDAGSRVRDKGDSDVNRGAANLKTRLERAQRELKNVLKRLPSNFKVNIIAYSSRVQIWRAGEGDKPAALYELNSKNRAAAAEFVDSFKADGVTATDTALERGYQVQGARCFYLLSDGFATHDGRTPVPTEQIIDLIDSYKTRHVIIHTLGFQGADKAMMQEVAKHTGGRYSDIQ